MYLLFAVLIAIISITLVLIIMVQNPKGGGLSSSFGGGGSQMFGVQSTNKFLDRTTWGLAISMFALILLSNFAIQEQVNKSVIEKNTIETQQGQPYQEAENNPLEDLNTSQSDTVQ